jgi:hypothetical protein
MKNMVRFISNLLLLDFFNEDLEAACGEGIFATLEHHEVKGLHGLLFMFFVKFLYSPNPCLHHYYKSWFFKRFKLSNLSF